MTKIHTTEDLENCVASQNAAIDALGELVKAMDARIKLLTSLVDTHHEIFIRQGICKPRPGGDSLVN